MKSRVRRAASTGVANKTRRTSFAKPASLKPRSKAFTPRSPARGAIAKNLSETKVAKGARAVSFISEAVKAIKKEGGEVNLRTLTATCKRLAKGRGREYRRAYRDGWVAKYIDAGMDLRHLFSNREGQGRKSAWSNEQKRELVGYVKKTPKAGEGGRKLWPSAERAPRMAAGGTLNVPVQSARMCCNILRSCGLAFLTRTPKCLLTLAMRRRRLAFANKYKNKTQGFWRATLFIDEGGQDTYLTGPRCCWQKADGSAPKYSRKVKGSKRVNFAVAPGYNVKLPLYTYTGGLTWRKFQQLCEEQLVPFFRDHPEFDKIVMDGDKTHPGQGVRQNLDINAYWREHPVLGGVEILAGPDRWGKDTGAVRTPDAQFHALECARNKMPGTEEVLTWPANSPGLNVAEHHAAAIKAPEDSAPGQYTEQQMIALYKAQNDAYPQACINRAVDSMPRRLLCVLEKDGWSLEHKDYC